MDTISKSAAPVFQLLNLYTLVRPLPGKLTIYAAQTEPQIQKFQSSPAL